MPARKSSPISSVPAKPPPPEAAFSFVRTDDGIVISNAPSRLSPKTKKTSAINPFTQDAGTQLHYAGGSERERRDEPDAAKQEDDSQAERQRLFESADCRPRRNTTW